MNSNSSTGSNPLSMLSGNAAVTMTQLRNAEKYRVLLLSGRKKPMEPFQEGYWYMLSSSLCPVFRVLSFTALVLLVDIVIFIAEVAIGFDTASSNLLQVNGQTLLKLGANSDVLVKSGEVWRLLSAIFVHVYFLHLFGNALVTFMFMSRLEYTYGVVRTVILYLLSGIAGNIFSIMINPGVKAGASTSLFGVIGAIFGYVIINWSGLDAVGPLMKGQLCTTLIVIVLFTLIFTPTASNIDVYGHLGGFLAGVWLSSIKQSIVDTTRERVIRGVFIGLFVVQLLTCFLIFFLK